MNSKAINDFLLNTMTARRGRVPKIPPGAIGELKCLADKGYSLTQMQDYMNTAYGIKVSRAAIHYNLRKGMKK